MGFNGAIKYNGPAPNPGRPSICQACPGIHSAPGAEPSTTTKSIITTKTDGAVCTEVDTIIVSSDKSGSWYTTTSGASINCGTTSEAPIPNPRVTITTTWTEITTATVTETGTKTDTVIVQVPTTPNPQITVTKPGLNLLSRQALSLVIRLILLLLTSRKPPPLV